MLFRTRALGDLQGAGQKQHGPPDTTVAVFHQMSAILERILTEQDLAGTFNAASQRYQLLMECLLS